MRSAVADVVTNTGELAELARRAADLARTRRPRQRAEQPAEHHGVAAPPLHRRLRRTGRTIRRLRARYDCDVNDVVLCVIAGALRNWLLSRGEPVTASLAVRAMAPTSVYPEADMTPSGPGRPSARWRRSSSTCR